MRPLLALLFCVCWFASSLAEDGVTPWPAPATFQSGDLLWPNKPGAFVPYSSGSERSPTSAEEAWSNARKQFFSQVAKKGTHLSRSDIDALKRMSFREFYYKYAGDRRVSETISYSNGNAFFFVGHVGILDIDEDGNIWIIDASLPAGVTRVAYSDWLKPLAGHLIWHGRIRGFAQSSRQAVADEARKYVGRPYEFWNFDLNDDKGFYCSKLVWLSILRALNVAVDGNLTAKRQFWFSPKQLLNTSAIAKLHNPSNYSRP